MRGKQSAVDNKAWLAADNFRLPAKNKNPHYLVCVKKVGKLLIDAGFRKMKPQSATPFRPLCDRSPICSMNLG